MTLAVQAKTLEEQAKTLAVQKLANKVNTFIIAIMKAIIVGNDYHQLIIYGQKNAMNIIGSVEKLAELVREEAGQARTAEDEEDEEDEDDAVGTEYDIQVIIEEIDDINKQKLEKILSIIQDFIYTECIDYIENSLADSIITLKLSSIEKKFEIEVKIQKLIEDTKQERIAYGATTSSRQETPLLHDGTVNIVLGNLTELLKETENRVYLYLPEAQKEVINAIKAQNYDSMVEDHIEDNDKDKASIALIKTHAAQAAYKAQHALINTVSLLKDTAFIIQSAQDFQKQNVEQIIINTKDLKQKALELAEIALIKAKEALEKDEMEQDDEKTVIQKTTDLLYRREEALKIVKNAMEVEGITKFSQNLIDRVSILDLINILQKAHEALEKAKITLLEEAKTQILKTQIDVRKIVTFAINSANQAIIKQDEEVQDVEYLGIKAQEKVDIAQQALGQLFDALHALEKAELIEEQKGEEPERIKINLLRELKIRQEELANKAINKAIVTLTYIEQQIIRADGFADFMPTINLLNLTLEKPYNKDSVHNALDNAKRLLNDIAKEQTTSRIKVEEAQSKLIEAYRMQNQTAYSLTDGILQTNIALDALKIVLDTLNRPLITLEQKYNLLIILVKLEQIALEQAKQVVSHMIYEIRSSYDIDEHVKSEAFDALTEDIRNVVQKQELLSQLNSEEQNIQLIMTTVKQALEALEKAKTTLTTYQNTTKRQGGKKQKKKKEKKGEILTFKF
jgi:predicted transcriptional regulator